MRGFGAWQVLSDFVQKQKFSTADISHIFLMQHDQIGGDKGLANQHLIPEFGELWSGGLAIRCSDMHQSLADALVSESVIVSRKKTSGSTLHSPYYEH